MSRPGAEQRKHRGFASVLGILFVVVAVANLPFALIDLLHHPADTMKWLGVAMVVVFGVIGLLLTKYSRQWAKVMTPFERGDDDHAV